MSLTCTQPDDTDPTRSGGWREFTDADARCDVIAAELALDLATDPLDTDL